MKRTITLLTALLLAGSAAQQAAAQQAVQHTARIHRTQALPYDTRHEAEQRLRADGGHYIAFTPAVSATDGTSLTVGAEVAIPYEWTDGLVFLHLENVRSAYSLQVNGQPVAEVEDSATPADFDLTPFIRQGDNDIRLVLRESRAEELNADPAMRKAFSESYLYFQTKRSIRDFEIALVPDTLGRDFGMLDLKIIAQNGFNYEEPVTVGYDIYSPQGKLLEFDMREVTIPGRSVDTVRFSPFIYGAFANTWSADKKNPPLYKVMLFTRREGTYKEYMPLRIGFGKTELQEGRIMRLGKEIVPVTAVLNAGADRTATAAELRKLKAAGKNTICPEYSQPAWFYELCDEIGLYVIDRANIHAGGSDDRRVGGTPANDPARVDEFIERVKAMYYRSRNFTCVIAYALGGPSGNGYNMYKAYEWLKSVEPSRPVIYEGAAGEWHSDL